MRPALLALLVAVAAAGAAPGPACPITTPEGTGTRPRVGPAPRRAKRSASPRRFVETLVVADESMARFHGPGLRPYLLTVLAAAARSLRHRSLGAELELRVTRLVVLGGGTPGPPVTPNATETLRNFCRWQRGLHGTHRDGARRFDTALLFTRLDLCGASTCATLGLAEVGSVCDPERSCAVVEDAGLPVALTVTHELGHLLDLPHDTAPPCRELNGPAGGSRRVMAPVLAALEPGRVWSPCSARFLRDFLDSGHGRCLLDEPRAWLRLPRALPGRTFPLERQCQLSFGPGSRPCGAGHPPCAGLWCSGHAGGRAVCQTRHFPWADGTPCAPGKSCVDGSCESTEGPGELATPVDGAWGPWGPWGGCSRSCGGGVRLSRRGCTAPEPRHGGSFCRGARSRARSCGSGECPGGVP